MAHAPGRPGIAEPGGLAQRLGTQLSPHSFFVSPGYYAPLPSWAEAEHCCGQAYQAESLVERYRLAARQAQSNSNGLQPIGPYAMRQLAALQHAWIALGRPGPLRVLDFGGALGSHFHALKPHWPWAALHWTVCETAAVAAAGAADFTCERPDGSQLCFTANPAEALAAGIDVVLAS